MYPYRHVLLYVYIHVCVYMVLVRSALCHYWAILRLTYREWVEVIRRVRTMPEQKVKSMLVQEVDPRKALLTLDLELIESVTATDQEKRYDFYHKNTSPFKKNW